MIRAPLIASVLLLSACDNPGMTHTRADVALRACEQLLMLGQVQNCDRQREIERETRILWLRSLAERRW